MGDDSKKQAAKDANKKYYSLHQDQVKEKSRRNYCKKRIADKIQECQEFLDDYQLPSGRQVNYIVEVANLQNRIEKFKRSAEEARDLDIELDEEIIEEINERFEDLLLQLIRSRK
jgi:hypothetical protein